MENFTVSIRRVTGGLCTRYKHYEHHFEIIAEELSDTVTFSELDELATYRTEVIAEFNFFDEQVNRSSTFNVTTSGAGKI